jgi:hypothetical protein
MNEQLENIVPTDQLESVEAVTAPPVEPELPAVPTAAEHIEGTNGVVEEPWHARAGREGARRVHQLIQAGRLYEQEHGLKRGRQRLRQLIELGKLYEQEHGLRPARAKKRGQRLSRLGRQELMATLLECLVRIAKPSFRAELTRLVQTLTQESSGHAA